MKLLLPKIYRTLSLRISQNVVFAIAILMIVALLLMLFYARRAVKHEALNKAEQTLAVIVHKTDNVLLSVEVAAGNLYSELGNHLGEPGVMDAYCESLLKANPYIEGCAIAFIPHYYKERGQYFMAYVRRADSARVEHIGSPVVMPETYGNVPYTRQSWFAKPLATGLPCWITPQKSAEAEAVITFSIPIYDSQRQQMVGVLGVDVSLQLLTDIVLESKPSPNSYATLIGSDGTFIVHPDSAKLFRQDVFAQTRRSDVDPSVREAAQAMVSGQTGYREFCLDGRDCYVFFKPFVRSASPRRHMEHLGWSVGIVYPEDDIFGDYNSLLVYTLAIALIGLLLLMVFCYGFVRRKLLPLRLLTQSVQRISKGNYDEPIPDTRQQDEVGRLQENFRLMQQSLAAHMGNLQQLMAQIEQQGKVLSAAYEQAQEADRLKTAFLHNMSDQMLTPVQTIENNVDLLCDHCEEDDYEKAASLVGEIREQGQTVTELLNDLLVESQKNR